MKENEAYQAIKNYSDSDGMKILFHGTGNGARRFADFFAHGILYQGDAPDMLMVKENEAIIIEHFEFDSCHVRRGKGSPARQELNRIQIAEDALIATEDGVFFNDEIKAKSSYSDLIANVTRSFKKHYSHIAMYKNNLTTLGLINDAMDVRVLFLLEDASPLGTMVSERKGFNSKIRPLVLPLCEDFLDLLRESPDLDYVLCCSSAGEENYVWFIDCREIDEYDKHKVDYTNMDFLSFNTQVMGVKFSIPRKDD